MKQERNETTNRSRVVDELIGNCLFNHPDLAGVALGGSLNVDSGGDRSDIDIVSVMTPDDPGKVDFDAIVNLSAQLNNFALSLKKSLDIQPVVISTIRLEEAQIALAEIFSHKAVVPLHWLHYPSLEFAKINEPPELFMGLLRGRALITPRCDIQTKFSETDVSEFSHLSGLDWLTDSFRVFMTNQSLLPQSFLNSLAMHNLEYFWKWRIAAGQFKQMTGIKFSNWNDLDLVQGRFPGDLMNIIDRIRRVRHLGARADTKGITDLHKITFDIWPL